LGWTYGAGARRWAGSSSMVDRLKIIECVAAMEETAMRALMVRV
jgi:hypothetical protein